MRGKRRKQGKRLLPKDDAIWVAELKARSQRVGERVYCSLVGFDGHAPCKWLYGDELEQYLQTTDHDKRSIELIISIFGEENVRVHLQGFPAMAQDRESVEELFKPRVWFKDCS